MTRPEEESSVARAALELLTENGFGGMADAIQILMNEAMALERGDFLNAGRYERTNGRRGYANGYKPKRVNSRLGALDLKVPQVRDLHEDSEPFYPRSLEQGERSERALKLAIAEMYVQGVSTRKVTEITRELCGLDISSTQVSRASKLLDDELENWRCRELGEVSYLVLDARYEKVRHGGSVVDCAVLVAAGVKPSGKRFVLGTSVSLSEAEVHWRNFLMSLLERGLHGVQMITSDAHAGLRSAIAACFSGVKWQRCQFHLQQNATAYVPHVAMRNEVARDIRAVFNAPDRSEADRLLKQAVARWESTAPRLAEWTERNLPEGLQVFAIPVAHRRRLRTSNMLERLNRELKRRTAVATLFPNEAALLRLVTAVLVEQSDEWETSRCYLNMGSE